LHVDKLKALLTLLWNEMLKEIVTGGSTHRKKDNNKKKEMVQKSG
jgi:hypothetical protein